MSKASEKKLTPEAFAEVIKSFSIHDISLESFDAKRLMPAQKVDLDSVQIEYKWTTTHKKGKNILVCVVEFDLQGNVDDKSETCFEITAQYQLIYESQEPLDTLDEMAVAFFSIKNAPYNAYPYFREFVSSSLARMGLPGLTMPLFKPGE